VVWRRLPVLHYLTLERWPGGQRAGNASPESGRAGCAEGAADPVAKDLEALDWFVAEDESHMALGYLVAHPTMGVAATLYSSRRADASIGSTPSAATSSSIDHAPEGALSAAR
jgi:hypothetical protein